MRRKSTRNSQKSPEKPKEETPVKPTRRSRRRKRSPSKSTDTDEEILTVTKRAPPVETEEKETPDTTTKSHSPSDDETSQEPVWKITTQSDTPQGEIQKLKICLTRPAPDSPDKKSRRSKSSSHTEDDEDKSSSIATRKTRSSRGSPFVRTDGLSSQEEDVEEKKGKGKSKGKHKSKIETPAHLTEPETQSNNVDISETAQVTPQSPSIDKPVDNENDYTKVDDAVVTINRTETRGSAAEDDSHSQTDSSCNKKLDSDSDDEPLSVIKTTTTTKTPLEDPETVETTPTATEPEPVCAVDKPKQPETPKTPKSDDEKVPDNAGLQVETPPTQEPDPEPETAVIPAELEPEKPEAKSTDPEPVAQPTKMPEVEPETDNSNDEPEKSVSVSEPELEPEQELPKKETSQVLSENEDVDMTDLSTPKSKPAIITTRKTESVAKLNKSEEKTEADLDKPKGLRRRLIRDSQLPKPEQNNSNNHDSESAEQSKETEHPLRLKAPKLKRKWSSSALTSEIVKIDLEVIQTACPSIEFPEEPDLSVEPPVERRRSVAEIKKIERKVSLEYPSDTSEAPKVERQISTGSGTDETNDKSNIIAFNRKISIVDDTASKLRPPPSPAKNPTSEFLFITNLVRPFTLKQLRDLLERTGSIVEEGFWTDKIKSKCYVQYNTAEEAEATRNALHGVQWPSGNGKKLIIEYASVEELQNAKNPPAPPPPVEKETKTSSKENMEPEITPKADDKSSREAERKKRSDGPIREWDIGKKDLRHERSRSRSRSRGHKHRRSKSQDDYTARKQRRIEDSGPQKMMDDLFLKTKATPSIYWQPLSPEEIAMKQQQRLLRMEEHKRRMEENSRVRMRDSGRGGFRRRYD